MAALDEERSLPDQESYSAYRAAQDPRWLEGYHRRFYEIRHAMAERDPEGWADLMLPYEPLLAVLRRRAGEAQYAIATAKDRRSVETLLARYGIADLFPPRLILDKETGARKTAHMQGLRELLGIEFSELTFVDDKVNHLDAVAPLGVRCALAAWGFNGRREHELAVRRGYLVCTMDDVEQQLFESA
jgi:phosphoglycolate phosphatase-like HAD superfamily hydrolase